MPPTDAPEPSATPDKVATEVAVQKAAAATLTAEAPTATDEPTAEPTATDEPTPTPLPTDTPTATPLPTDAPVFAVLGNHDHWAGAQPVRNALKRGGAEILVERVRKRISPKKASADGWLDRLVVVLNWFEELRRRMEGG